MRRAAFVLLLLWAGAAWSQAEQPAAAPAVPERLPVIAGPVTLTPDLAAAMAVSRSVELAIADQSVAAARARVLQAEALRELQISAQASYTRSGPSQSFEIPGGEGGSISLSPGAVHRETISVTKPVYLGKRDRYAREAAQAGVEAAEQNVDANTVNLAYVARQAVFTLLRLDQLKVVTQQRVTALTEHLRITTAMFDQGTVPRFEVVQAETEIARARGEMIRAQMAVAQQKAALAQLLNLPQGTELVAEEGVPGAAPEGDLQVLIGRAQQQRNDIAAAEAGVRAQQANLRLARAYNNVTLVVQGNLNHGTATAAAGSLGWDLTVAVSKPLLRRKEAKSVVLGAEAGLRTAELNVERLQQAVAREVTQALLDVGQAREQLTVAEQGEVEARERLRIAEVRFLNGVSLGVEVLDAQTALAAAQTQVINARYDLQVAVAALRAAVGLSDLAKENAG